MNITFLFSSTMISSTNMILKRSGTTKTTVVCTIAVICNAVTWVILSDSDRFGSILVKVRRTSRSTRFRVTKQKRLSPRNLVFHMQPYETWSLKISSFTILTSRTKITISDQMVITTQRIMTNCSVYSRSLRRLFEVFQALQQVSLCPKTKFYWRFDHSISHKNNDTARVHDNAL